MKENLSRCLDLIGVSEAGYSDHPDDPGGPTNHGVTQRTLAAWRKATVTPEDVKALTIAEAREILASQYATPIHFDDLPSGLDYCVLDAAVNSGPDRAARLLQETLGMPELAVDGTIGLHTLDAVRTTPDMLDLITSYSTARLAFDRTLKNWGTFGNGWISRVGRVEADAKAMYAGYLPNPGVVVAAPAEDAGQAKAGGAVKVTTTRSGKAAIINVAATVATAVVTAGTAATQASGVLQPYADIRVIRYVLLGLAVVSAAGTLAIALRRAHDGKTS